VADGAAEPEALDRTVGATHEEPVFSGRRSTAVRAPDPPVGAAEGRRLPPLYLRTPGGLLIELGSKVAGAERFVSDAAVPSSGPPS
jgi:hypothetical protein